MFLLRLSLLCNSLCLENHFHTPSQFDNSNGGCESKLPIDFAMWTLVLYHVITEKAVQLTENILFLFSGLREKESLHLTPTLDMLFIYLFIYVFAYLFFISILTNISNCNYLVLKMFDEKKFI